LLSLEEQIKSKKDKTNEDLKKLESLEMIKKEFKQSFEDGKNPELVEGKSKKPSQQPTPPPSPILDDEKKYGEDYTSLKSTQQKCRKNYKRRKNFKSLTIIYY
jgi:hypothetical protein